MSTSSGTVAVNVTNSPGTGFIFQETSNTTGGAVSFSAGKRLFQVLTAGTYDLNFTATNFTLADPPIGFPDGEPPWLTLLSFTPPSQFSVQTVNSGSVPNQTGRFLIHSTNGLKEQDLSAVAGGGGSGSAGLDLDDGDPTVVNNPIPPTSGDEGEDEDEGSQEHGRPHGQSGRRG
jgi:hypothetical protein